MPETTPEQEAINTIRARDPQGWANASDEQIAKLAQTQWLAFSIALRRLWETFVAPFRGRP